MKINFNNPTEEREHSIVGEGGEGIQKIWKFPNGYGASVIRFSTPNLFDRKEKIGSYGVNEGLWELAVIKFIGKEYTLDYSTPITKDVIGYLNEKEVEKILLRISKLKSNEKMPKL